MRIAVQSQLGNVGTLRVIPSWCDYVPFGDYVDACQPYSKAELDADSREALAKIRAVNPDLARQAEQRIAEIEAADRSNRRDLEAFWSNPALSRILGTSTVATAKDVLDSDYTPVIAAGVALVSALLIVKGRR